MGGEKAELEDEERLFYLAFLADFTSKLSNTNLKLQGKSKFNCRNDEYSFTLQNKFELMMTDLTNNILITFLICRNIWKNILILFFRQKSILHKFIRLSKISEIDYLTPKKLIVL
jgi:hypothetical protein